MRILLTGGTGFIGASLGIALLKQGHEVIFLSRGRNGESALERIQNSGVNGGRWSVVEGDITEPSIGISSQSLQKLRGRIDEIFHCAASISFKEDEQEVTYGVNVKGTYNVMKLVAEMRISRVHHVSTLYVCGDRTGLVLEDELYKSQMFRNPYERTKAEGEKLAKEFADQNDLDLSIYRLPIVVGNSQTGECSAFTGYYAFFSPFAAIMDSILKKVHGSEIERRKYAQAGIQCSGEGVNVPVILRCGEGAISNLVSVDWVTKILLALRKKPEAIGKTFHIAHEKPPLSEDIMRFTLEAMKFNGVIRIMMENGNGFRIEHPSRILRGLQRTVDRVVEYYNPYTKYPTEFSLTNLKKVLGNEYVIAPPMDKDMFSRLIDYAMKVNFGRVNGINNGFKKAEVV